MNNQIVIHIEFYFKGEKFSPSAVVDLDRHVEKILDKAVGPASALPVLKRFGFRNSVAESIESVKGETSVRDWISKGERSILNRALYVGIELGRLEMIGARPPWRK